jgi:Tfp pilus assembly protein PilF
MAEQAESTVQQESTGPQAAQAPEPAAALVPAPAPTAATGGGWLRFIPGLRRKNAADHLRQAQRFVEKQNLSQALQAYEQALEADPRCTRAHQGIAMLLTRRGGREQLRAALAHILEAVRVDPYDPQNYRINALVFQRIGKKKHMQIELRCMAITHTLKRYPEHPVANNQMGVLLLRQFRMDLATDHFQRAIQVQPRYEAALRNLARICCARAETAEPAERATLLSIATQHVEKALESAPTSAAWTILARIRVLNGQPREAMEAVMQAERIGTLCRDLPAVKAEVQLALASMAPAAAPDAPNSASMR